MLTTMRLTSMSADVKESMGQTVDAFGVALSEASKREPGFEKISELAFCFGVAHPLMQASAKGRANYSRNSRAFFTEACLDYAAWIGDRWSERVDAVALAAQGALSAVHGTRLSAKERSTLSRLIEIVRQHLAKSQPDHLRSLEPVYAIEDQFGQRLSIQFRPPSPCRAVLATQRIVELQPERLEAYVREQEQTRRTEEMIKLYKRSQGQLLYREVWIDGEHVVEHVGVYGDRGSTSRQVAAGQIGQQEMMDAFVANAVADGFKAIPHARLVGLSVGKEGVGVGTQDELRCRHALEDFLNEVTGWRGLGHCDGGSIGSGTIEAFCLVVDYAIAAEVIARELASSPFSDFAVTRMGK